MYQRFNISLRLPLHLFVGEKSEQIVMDKIEECYSKINTSWTLKFWVDGQNSLNPPVFILSAEGARALFTTLFKKMDICPVLVHNTKYF